MKRMSYKYVFSKGCGYGAKRHFQQYFSYIMVVSFNGRGNQRFELTTLETH